MALLKFISWIILFTCLVSIHAQGESTTAGQGQSVSVSKPEGEALTESTTTAEAAATSSITHVTTRRNDGTTPAKTASQQTTIASIGSTENSKETTGPDKPVQPTSLDENGNSLTSDASTTKEKAESSTTIEAATTPAVPDVTTQTKDGTTPVNIEHQQTTGEPFGSIENLQKTTAPDESVKTTSSDEKDATVITDAKTTSGEFHTTKGKAVTESSTTIAAATTPAVIDVTTQTKDGTTPVTIEHQQTTEDVVIVDSRPDSLTTETKSQEVHFVKTTTDQVDPVQSTSSDKTDTTLIPAGKTTVEGLSPELTTEGDTAVTSEATPQASEKEEVVVTTVVVVTTEEQEAAQTTEAVWTSDDPCTTTKILGEKERHLSQKLEGDKPFCDELEEQWYAFKYQNQWAEIPSVAIKKGHCSTNVPFRLDLSKGQNLPDFNETVDLQLCAAYEIEGNIEECAMMKKIQVKNCGAYYVYYLQPLMKKCSAAICTQLPDEGVQDHVMANPPVEPEIIPTTEAPLPINKKSVKELSKDEQAGVATVTFSYPNETLHRPWFLDFDRSFIELLVKYLNENPESMEEPTQAMTGTVPDVEIEVTTAAQQEAAVTADVNNDSQNSVMSENEHGTETQDPSLTNNRRRCRRNASVTEEPLYSADSVIHVSPTPRLKDGKLEMALIVKDKDGNVVPADVLKRAIENMENPSNDPAVKQEEVVVGLPVDLVSSPAKQPRKNIWDAHMGLWITIIVLCAVCIITLIVCCVCFRCCDTEDSQPEKSPLQMEEGKKTPAVVIENPLSDEEITRDEAPMVERENPAFTSNGGGQHLTKDEDNGWIVPLEQLTDADKQKADVENTKL